MRKVGVKVFQMHSRGESMVLKIDETDELVSTTFISNMASLSHSHWACERGKLKDLKNLCTDVLPVVFRI